MAIVSNTNEAAIRARFNELPQDSNGWTILTPSADSRIMYVDPNGDDGTAVDYTLATLPGGTWDLPTGISAYATIEAATAQMRDGYADYVLLKKGEEHTLATAHWRPSKGRSITERAVISSYGTGARPHFNPGTNKYGLRIWTDDGFIVIKGLHIYPTWRDPDHVDFAGWTFCDANQGIYSYAGGIANGSTDSMLIEDNLIEFCEGGISLSNNFSYGDGLAYNDIIIRRNVIRHAWSDRQHAQGISGNRSSLLIEDNVFDHNGWYKQRKVAGVATNDEGQATLYNHNVYVGHCEDAIIKNNVSIAPSSIHFKLTASRETALGVNSITAQRIILDNNFCIEGEFGFSLGGNDDYDDGPRWAYMSCCNNVLTEIGSTRPTLRSLAWGIEADDWSNGFVGNNLVFEMGDDTITGTFAFSTKGAVSNTTLSRNTSVNTSSLTTTAGGAIQFRDDAGVDSMSSVLWTDNIVQNLTHTGRIFGAHEITTVTHARNTYYTLAADADAFSYNGSYVTQASFQTSVNDTTSTQTQITFVDSTLDIPSYMTSLGQTATIAAFKAKCSAQGDGTWDVNYTAPYINAYFRAGFTPV